MHTETSNQDSQFTSKSATEVVLRVARHLHRAITSESLSVSLPILRRLLATSTLTAISLPELQRSRDIIQRKHILRMLAVEAGFKCWEEYRHALDCMAADELTHYDQFRGTIGYPNQWFSTYEEAQAYASTHSGRVLRVGTQAVVLIN